MTPTRILIVAGEASGDLHGAHLIEAIHSLDSNYEFYGLGGNKMRSAGAETFFDIERMGAVGIVEVLGDLGHYVKVYRRFAREVANGGYDAVILIDYPTLNLRLARLCQEKGIPVFYVIGPQLWAWRAGRIKEIKRDVSKMFVIFPFEEEVYRKAGVDVEFVGHPFTETVAPKMTRSEAQSYFDLKPDCPTVGLLPGSRRKEIEMLLGPMLEGAQEIAKELETCQFILPVADSIDPEALKKKAAPYNLNIQFVSGKTYDVMNVCDCLIIASGSATLEAAMIGTPMVIVYKLNPLTYWMARPLVKIDLYGLANITAGEQVVPELIQGDLNAESIKRETLKFLKDPEYSDSVRQKLLGIRKSLGRPGVMERIAQSIVRSLGTDEKKE